MTDIMLRPGETPLAAWMAIYLGAAVRLDRSCRPRGEKGAEAGARILDAGRSVYDINTGFDKLATVRIQKAGLEAVHRLPRPHVGHLDNDRYLHEDVEKAITLVRDGVVIAAAGGIALPEIARARQ